MQKCTTCRKSVVLQDNCVDYNLDDKEIKAYLFLKPTPSHIRDYKYNDLLINKQLTEDAIMISITSITLEANRE